MREPSDSTGAFEILAQAVAGGAHLVRLGSGDLVAVVGLGRGGAADVQTEEVATIEAGLVSAGILRTYQNVPYLYSRGKWRALESSAAVRTMLHNTVHLVSPRDPEEGLSDTLRANVDDRGQSVPLARNPRVIFHRSSPRELASSLVGVQGRPSIPDAVGVLRHPVHGEPDEPWLQDDQPILPAEDRRYEKLRLLFSALDLSAAAHTAVYCYLLGAFHAISLSAPRPILLVDSWIQGRGKSELCSAISQLVDQNEATLSARANTDKFDDTLVAALRCSRSVTIDNIDGIAEWNMPTIATAATGIVQVRHKYGREATPVHGLLTMLNLVVGAASIHSDMLSRSIRCEIPGLPEKLEVPPRNFAREHREQIISEILRALATSEGRQVPVDAGSRFEEFDSVALAAYCEVFEVRPDEARENLDCSRRSAKIHSMQVLEHLRCMHSDKFMYLNDKIFQGHLYNPTQASKIALPQNSDGASAFGLVLRDGAWEEAKDA